MARLGRSQRFTTIIIDKMIRPPRVDYVLTASAGSYAISGVDAALKAGYKVTSAAGSYAISGNVATLTTTAAPAIDQSDGVGGRKKRRKPLVLGKPYDALIQDKRDKEAQDLEDLQAILEGRPARILKPPPKPNVVQLARAKKGDVVTPVTIDDEDEDIEMLLLYG